MENVNNAQDVQKQNHYNTIKKYIGELVDAASKINEHIKENHLRSIWPYTDSLSNRLNVVINTIMGENKAMMDSVTAKLSIVHSINQEVELSGWSDEITGKIAVALTFDTEDGTANDAICDYFFDICAFVAGAQELLNHIATKIPEEDRDEFDKLIKPVISTLETIETICAA